MKELLLLLCLTASTALQLRSSPLGINDKKLVASALQLNFENGDNTFTFKKEDPNLFKMVLSECEDGKFFIEIDISGLNVENSSQADNLLREGYCVEFKDNKCKTVYKLGDPIDQNDRNVDIHLLERNKAGGLPGDFKFIFPNEVEASKFKAFLSPMNIKKKTAEEAKKAAEEGKKEGDKKEGDKPEQGGDKKEGDKKEGDKPEQGGDKKEGDKPDEKKPEEGKQEEKK